MSAVSVTGVSLQEYLDTVYRPDCEYLDGEILERNVGEWDHSRLQTLLSSFLFNREKDWGILVVVEQRFQVRPTRFRIPDILVMAADAPIRQIIDTPPLLCVEILSPRDRITEMQDRIDDYFNLGVRCVWVIDPRTRRAFVYTPGEVREAKDGILRVQDSKIRISLPELE